MYQNVDKSELKTGNFSWFVDKTIWTYDLLPSLFSTIRNKDGDLPNHQLEEDYVHETLQLWSNLWEHQLPIPANGCVVVAIPGIIQWKEKVSVSFLFLTFRWAAMRWELGAQLQIIAHRVSMVDPLYPIPLFNNKRNKFLRFSNLKFNQKDNHSKASL